MRLMSLDPGGTTGWAILEKMTLQLQYKPGEPGIRLGHMADDKHEHHKELHDFIEREHSQDMQIICESFEYRHNQDRTTVSLVSKEYIGVLKLLEQERCYTLKPIVWQTAGKVIPGPAGKAFWTDDKIAACGLWWPGHRHAMDALRHMLYYISFGPRTPELGLLRTELLRRLK